MQRAAAVATIALLAVTGLAPAVAAQYSDVDIREANVVGVEWRGVGDDYRFDVTLYHDDDGEPGYADHWQVETLDGDRLGRRDLAHPHGTRRFTRSADVTVPEGVATVVVRGHDQTHGYGGRAVLVHLVNGTARTVEQGSEPRDFGATADPDGEDADGGSPRSPDDPEDDTGADEGAEGAGNATGGTAAPPADGADGDAAGEDTPAPGPLVALAVLASTGLVAARR